MTVLKQLKTKISEIATVLLCPLELFSKDSENAFAGKEKTGADGRDRSLSLQRGSFAYYRKVPMVVRAAGESTGGEQLASSWQAVGKQLARYRLSCQV
mgnify:CR=1